MAEGLEFFPMRGAYIDIVEEFQPIIITHIQITRHIPRMLIMISSMAKNGAIVKNPRRQSPKHSSEISTKNCDKQK